MSDSDETNLLNDIDVEQICERIDLAQEQELLDQVISYYNQDTGLDQQFLDRVEQAISNFDCHPMYVQVVVGVMSALHSEATNSENWNVFRYKMENIYDRKSSSSQIVETREEEGILQIATSLWNLPEVPTGLTANSILSASSNFITLYYAGEELLYVEGDQSDTIVGAISVVDISMIKSLISRLRNKQESSDSILENSIKTTKKYWSAKMEPDAAFIYDSKKNGNIRTFAGAALFYISDDSIDRVKKTELSHGDEVNTKMYQPRDVKGNKIGSPIPIGGILPTRTTLRKMVDGRIVSYLVPSGVIFGGGFEELEQAILDRHSLVKDPTTGNYENA